MHIVYLPTLGKIQYTKTFSLGRDDKFLGTEDLSI